MAPILNLPSPDTRAATLARLDCPIPTLVNAGPDPAAVIAACQAFAAAQPPGTPALIVSLLPAAPDLLALTARATLQTFTRFAALHWAPRRIRLTAITLGADVPPEDLARTIAFLAASPSITGQIIHLGL